MNYKYSPLSLKRGEILGNASLFINWGELKNKMQKTIQQLCRELRKDLTPSEKIVWEVLRNRKFENLKFTRQYPIIYNNYGERKLFFIADFYCHEKKLVIELDGKIHDFQKEYDANRDLILQELSLNVLRLKNEELENIETVFEKIRKSTLP